MPAGAPCADVSHRAAQCLCSREITEILRGLTAGNVVDLSAVPEADLHRLGNTPN